MTQYSVVPKLGESQIVKYQQTYLIFNKWSEESWQANFMLASKLKLIQESM